MLKSKDSVCFCGILALLGKEKARQGDQGEGLNEVRKGGRGM